MKKILIATDTFFPRIDGVSRFLMDIIPELEKEYEVRVIAPDFGTEKSTEKIKRIPSFGFQVGDLAPAKFKIRDIRREVKNTDIVFAQTIAPIGAISIFLGKMMGKKVVTYKHVIEWEVVTDAISKNFLKKIISYPLKLFSRWLHNKCDLIIVPSAGIVELLNKHKIKSKKVVVHMGVNPQRFVPTKNKAASKIRINISPEKKVIGYVGRLAREKDLKTLYRAFLRLRKKEPNAVLLIVGGGLDEIKKVFRKKKGVIMAGRVKNVVPYLQAMDIYVLPSLTETSSLSTMEAMSCKIPVVVTPVGYVKDYVVDGFNGYFFPKRDSYALARKLEKLLAKERLRNKMGINARKTVETYFSWDKTANKIKKILEGI